MLFFTDMRHIIKTMVYLAFPFYKLKAIFKKDIAQANINSILIYRFDFIGDMVLTSLFLENLRQAYPKAKISLVAGPWSKQIIEDNPNIDELIIFTNPYFNRRKKTPFKNTLNFIKEIRKRKFDLVIAFRGELGTILFQYLTKGKYKVGYDYQGYGKLLDKKIKDQPKLKDQITHEVDRTLNILRLLNKPISKDSKLFMPTNLEASQKAFEFYNKYYDKKDLIIGIHPGGDWLYKCWFPKRFAKVADELIEKHKAKIILFTPPTERWLAEKVQFYMKGKAKIVDDLNLKEFSAFVKRCNLFIGNDTGTTHLASVFTPTISLLGPGYYERCKLFPQNSITIRNKVACAPCDQGTSHQRCVKHFPYCMAAISVREVLNAAELLLKC